MLNQSAIGVLSVLLHIDEGRVSGADVIEDTINDVAETLGFGRGGTQEDFILWEESTMTGRSSSLWQSSQQVRLAGP